MNYIARNVPTAPPLPGGRPSASVLLRGKRRASGRCARQARGRRDLGQPVGDVQVAGPGRACARAARGTGHGVAHSLALDHGLRPLFASVGATVIAHGVYATSEQFADGTPAAELRAAVDRAVREAVALASAGSD